MANLKPPKPYRKIVKKADRYIDDHPRRAVSISKLCKTLGVTRRTLHRAFDAVVGIGPFHYVRRKRLETVRTILKKKGRSVLIGEVAKQNGFSDTFRFARYYREVFGEAPIRTAFLAEQKKRRL